MPQSSTTEIPSGGGVGIMNSPRVTKGNFNSPRVVKPQVVGIEIDLSDKWRIHYFYFEEIWKCRTLKVSKFQNESNKVVTLPKIWTNNLKNFVLNT